MWFCWTPCLVVNSLMSANLITLFIYRILYIFFWPSSLFWPDSLVKACCMFHEKEKKVIKEVIAEDSSLKEKMWTEKRYSPWDCQGGCSKTEGHFRLMNHWWSACHRLFFGPMNQHEEDHRRRRCCCQVNRWVKKWSAVCCLRSPSFSFKFLEVLRKLSSRMTTQENCMC